MGRVGEGLQGPDRLEVARGDQPLEGGGGVADEEGFLALGAGGGEAGGLQDGFQPIPGDVAGEVLLPDVGQQVTVQPMGTVGARRAAGRAGEQLRQGLAVIEQDGGARPPPAKESGEERLGRERDVERRALVPRVGQGRDQGPPLGIGGRAVDGLGERPIIEHPHPEVHPTSLMEPQATEGLGIEELVGDEHARAAQVEVGPEPQDTVRGEAMGDRSQGRGAGLGADLDQGVAGEVAEDARGGLREQLAEDGAERGGGREVGVGPAAHPHTVRGVVAGGRMEEDDLDEGVEAQDAARRAAAELGEQGLAMRHGETVADAGRLASGNRRFPLDGGGGYGNPWAVILAVESSCDESALALLDPARGLVRELVASQVDLHARHGGVVPDLASREHLAALPLLLRELGDDLRATPPEVVAVTRGPGLLPCLSLGVAFARALALAHGARLVGVNHLRAHVHSPFLALHAADPAGFAAARAALLPHLGLVVSGGNTLVVRLGEDLRMTVVARTVDDAAGEALDKGAKLMGLPYPGGALVERRAAAGDPARFAFPRGIPERADPRLSFSGLKTALRYQVEKLTEAELAAALPDLCAGYQEAVVAQLESKLGAALDAQACRSVGLSGGVANNRTLRARLQAVAARRGVPLLIAEPRHCGDNAAMVAFAALADTDLPEGAAVRAEASAGVEG